MNTRASVTHVARNFSDYINRVVFRGERFTLVRGKRPVALLGPAPTGLALGDLPALLDSLPHLEPGDAVSFGEDLSSARSALAAEQVTDPWES